MYIYPPWNTETNNIDLLVLQLKYPSNLILLSIQYNLRIEPNTLSRILALISITEM